MTITWEIIAAFIFMSGTLAGAFWKIYGLIDAAKTEAIERAQHATALASLTQSQLHEHKLHVAETYTTKAGMAEQTAQIMKALDGVSGKIDYTNQRLDAWSTPKTPARPRG
jgi:uncharacterized protein YpmB